MRSVFGKAWMALFVALSVTACSRSTFPGGPLAVDLIQPAGPGCAHVIAPVTLQTLTDLNTLTGAIGSVVQATRKLGTTSDVQDPTAFEPVPANFYESGGVYYPSNYQALYAGSLYYAIELAYLTHRGLDADVDAARIAPNFASTLIVLDPTITQEGAAIEDNAAYLPVYFNTNDQFPHNLFLSFPTTGAESMPLGLNTGVLGHEFTHLIFQHLFTIPERTSSGGTKSLEDRAPRISSRTIGSLDEGIADYFGFLTSKDPSFFLCSFPEENRDLRKAKDFTNDFVSRIQTASSYDIHEGGAIFAAINYEIGQALSTSGTDGHAVNGRALHALVRTLNTCVQPARAEVTFADIVRCHVSAAGSAGATVQEVYSRHLGGYGAAP